MDVIYTDAQYVPQGVQKYYAIDLDIGGRNDFEIKTAVDNVDVEKGSLWYVEGEEYGGVVDRIKLNSSSKTAYISGRAWRGVLQKKIIEPKAKKDYYTVSGELNYAIGVILKRLGLTSIFRASAEDSGIRAIMFRFDRYTDAYTGMTKLLDSANAKMVLKWEDGKVVIGAKPKEDLSNYYEYSDDYGMRVIIDNDHSGVNHLICLGQGELKDRMVRHLYVGADGNIGTTKYYSGMDEITEVFDYPSAGSEEELIKNGTERLMNLRKVPSMSATFDKLNVDIGDIVGGRNRVTGIVLKDYVNSLIINIENGRVRVEYNVGGEAKVIPEEEHEEPTEIEWGLNQADGRMYTSREDIVNNVKFSIRDDDGHINIAFDEDISDDYYFIINEATGHMEVNYYE